jgi:phage terminase large subunit-like protein
MGTVPKANGLDWLLVMSAEERLRYLAQLSAAERAEMPHDWRLWARDGQLPPEGEWHLWLVMAGRGFGKTRMGAEWVRAVAQSDPAARIALVAASLGEARSVMVEGESGVLRCSPARRRPRFEPSLKRLVWPNGAVATLYSAAEPDSLRGPQHSHAWCDEIAKWDNAGARAELAWDNMLMGLRLGETPRAMATTTPRAVPLLNRLLADEEVIVTRGRTEDNRANLPQRYIRDIRRSLGSALLARQELDGEMLVDHAGALWTRALIERCREVAAGAPPLRLVVGVDPDQPDPRHRPGGADQHLGLSQAGLDGRHGVGLGQRDHGAGRDQFALLRRNHPALWRSLRQPLGQPADARRCRLRPGRLAGAGGGQ